ncbi:MAG: hypothetical protein Q4Q55_00090 [Methanobrevibacter sp.]|nr:hypothetical protein [Methanobrevibacter sp.]
MNNSKSAQSSNRNLIERFRDASIFPKLIVITVAVFIFGNIGHFLNRMLKLSQKG